MLLSQCPKCDHRLHRAKHRSITDRAIRLITGKRRYGCRKCGFVIRQKPPTALNVGNRLRTALLFVLFLAISVGITFYSLRRYSEADVPRIAPSDQ